MYRKKIQPVNYIYLKRRHQGLSGSCHTLQIIGQDLQNTGKIKSKLTYYHLDNITCIYQLVLYKQVVAGISLPVGTTPCDLTMFYQGFYIGLQINVIHYLGSDSYHNTPMKELNDDFCSALSVHVAERSWEWSQLSLAVFALHTGSSLVFTAFRLLPFMAT